MRLWIEGAGVSDELWILGGERSVAEAVAERAREQGHEVRTEDSAIAAEATPGCAVLDLGLPPASWPEGEELVEEERARVTKLAERIPEGVRLLRASIFGAGPSARTTLQRAQGAAEEATLGGRADAVVLRSGILFGPCGLSESLRAGLERFPLVFLPGISQAKFEPLTLEDYAIYCVEAAFSQRELDSIYELGCGEILTGGLFARGLAENLGVSRWIFPAPGFLRSAVASALASEELPARALAALFEALAGGLLARRMSAWEHFPVKPVELREGLARAAGMILPLREREEKVRFAKWRRPPKKRGLLGLPKRERR